MTFTSCPFFTSTGTGDAEFQTLANKAKTGCPVSKALAGTNIELDASLI